MTNIVQTWQYQTTQQFKNAPKKKINLPPHNNFQPNHITSKNSHESKWQKKKLNNNAHHKVLNQASNQQINQQKQKKKKKMISPWSP